MSQIRTSLISKLADLVDEYGDQSPQDVDSIYDLSDHDEGEFFERREHIDKAIDSSMISRSLSLANLKNIPIENLISHPRLGNLLNKLHYILYLNVNQLKQDIVDSNVDSHLEVVESLIDYVSGQSKAVKFDSIDSLLISCLYSIATFVHLTQPAQRLDAKIGVISAKINLLFDGKLTGLEEPGQKPMLFKALKYFVYLIEHIKDPKCIVTLWKLFSKLVFKLKILIPISTHRHSAMIRKIFDILVVDQKMNLKHIKMTLKNQSSLNGENLPSQSFNSQSISSQIRFTNNVVQDTIKVIKLSSFLFKILSTFLRLHLSDLLTDDDDNNASQSLTSILVQISSICLDEAMSINLENDDSNTTSFETTSKRFNAIKLDFIKEYAPNFEQLLQCVLNEPRFIDSLNQIDRVLQEDEESFNHSSILLFFAICLNKHDAEFEKSMEEIIRLLILSQEQIYSPIYSTYSKKLTQDPQLDFNRLVADSDTRAVEFYDLLLLIVAKFTLQSGLSASKVYYLVANITSQEPVRSQLAYDLILYLLRHYASTSNFPNFLHLVKFISVVYESTNSVGLKQLLNEMLNDSAPPSSVATDLEQYYTTNKMHRCLSLMNSNLLFVLAANTVGCSVEMIDCLLKMMSTSPSEPIAVRKSLQYVQTNKMIQVLELAAGLLLKSVDKGAPSSQLVDLAEKCARKLSEFVRADKIDALLVNSQNQRVLFELLLRALNLLAVTLLVFSDDEILLGLIEFYLKWCSNKSSKISSQNESLKFAAIECLRLMARRKQPLNNQQIQSKMIELFQEILDESNSNANLRYFALECLNDYSNSDEPSKNRVFCQLNRMGLNKLISGYLVEIEIDPSFDLSKYLSDRLSSTSAAVSGGYSSQQCGNSQLDETMNVLMSAASMDTTISAENEIDESEMGRERLEKIEADLRALVGSYPTGRLPNWLRAQLNNLSQFISKNL